MVWNPLLEERLPSDCQNAGELPDEWHSGLVSKRACQELRGFWPKHTPAAIAPAAHAKVIVEDAVVGPPVSVNVT